MGIYRGIISPFIGFILNKFIERIDYSNDNSDNSDNVSLIFRENSFLNNRFPIKIKKIEINSLDKILGIDLISILIDASVYITSYQCNQKLSIIEILLILLFSVFMILILLLLVPIYLVINIFLPNLKKRIICILKKILNGFILKFAFRSLSIDIEIPINNQQEKLNMKVVLKSFFVNLIDAVYMDFVFKFENLQFELANLEKNKKLINAYVRQFKISKKNHKCLTIKSNIAVYFSLFDINTIIDFVNQFKSLSTKSKKNKKTKNDDNNKIQLNMKVKTKIENIEFYIIKSNLPLLQLNIIPHNFECDFETNDFVKRFEVKFELKHLCHRTYNVIDRFSTIISFEESEIYVLVSPIYVSLPSFLFKELMAPECNDEFHSKMEHQYKNLFFQNDTGLHIKLSLKKKEKNRYNFQESYVIELANDTPVKIREEDYENSVEAEINSKSHSFLISSLYSPIYLVSNVVVSLKSENGINIVHFTSPYVVQNCLNYDITFGFLTGNNHVVESGKDKYIPCGRKFNLSNSMFVTRSDEIDFQMLEFKGSEPVKLTSRKFQIDSEPVNFYATYFLSFQTKKTMCSINFFPYITITSFLPNEISMRISYIYNAELKPGIYNDISFMKDIKEEKFFYFCLKNNKASSLKKITGNFKEELDVFDKNMNEIGKIVFECSELKIDSKKIFKLKVYSPLILQNCTSVPLSLQQSKNIIYNFHDNYLYYSSKGLMDHKCKVELPIVYEELTKVNTKKINVVGNIAQMIPLEHKNKNQINFFLLFEKQKNKLLESLNVPSSIITIKPYLKVHSDVNETVIFQARCTNSEQSYYNRCPKGDSVIFGASKEGFFNVYVVTYRKCYNFNIFTLGSSVIRLVKKTSDKYILLKLVVKKEDNGFCCYISYPNPSSAVSIKNLTDKNLYIQQVTQNDITNYEYHPMLIGPNQKLIYAKEQPFLGEQISNQYDCIVSFGSVSSINFLSYDKSCHAQKIENSNYCYDVQKNDRENIEITIYKKSNQLDKNQKNENKSVKPKISFSLCLTEMQASFIDDEMHELFLVAINKVNLNVSDQIKFYIEGFVINDMYSQSVSPVVLNGKKTPFLYVEITSKYPFKAMMFEDITISIAPIQIFVDLIFISDLIAIMMEIADCFSQFELKDDFLYSIFSTKKFTIEDIYVCLTPSFNLRRSFRFEHNDYFYLSFFNIPFKKVISFNLKEVKRYNIEAPMIDFLKYLPYCYLNQITLFQGILFLLKFIFLIPEKSMQFSDFLRNRRLLPNDVTLELPRRIPRAFPNGNILPIPACLTNEYPDFTTLMQYILQVYDGIKYSNEQLKEIFFHARDKKSLAIFDHVIFIFGKDSDNERTIIRFDDIKSIEYDYSLLTINYSRNRKKYFVFKTKEEAHSCANKINYFVQKLKISKQ